MLEAASLSVKESFFRSLDAVYHWEQLEATRLSDRSVTSPAERIFLAYTLLRGLPLRACHREAYLGALFGSTSLAELKASTRGSWRLLYDLSAPMRRAQTAQLARVATRHSYSVDSENEMLWAGDLPLPEAIKGRIGGLLQEGLSLVERAVWLLTPGAPQHLRLQYEFMVLAATHDIHNLQICLDASLDLGGASPVECSAGLVGWSWDSLLISDAERQLLRLESTLEENFACSAAEVAAFMQRLSVALVCRCLAQSIATESGYMHHAAYTHFASLAPSLQDALAEMLRMATSQLRCEHALPLRELDRHLFGPVASVLSAEQRHILKPWSPLQQLRKHVDAIREAEGEQL